ncbi:efflux RND transporter periplasmic adaptor subunit [uncultured Ramlibacter sp.]|uniref:efflux RND transporter periplasmic adaptor subunit n=1 Tax=uncultured Ramlibacter sp. TaxID=260755 RepID=UPI00345C35EB
MDPRKPEPPFEAVDGPPALPARKRISRRASIIGSVVALLVVGGVGWLAWSLTHPQVPAAGAPGAARPGGGAPGVPGSRGPATTVGVAVAERADIPVSLEALGTVVPQATVRVRPQVGGVLQQVLFKEGQLVRKGELLATIDPRQFEMTLQQAIGQRQRDEAQLEAAKVTLERYRTLLQQDSIARQEVDTQSALVKQLEAAVVITKANEGTARLNLGYTRIVSPIAGRVGLRTVDVGNVVGTGDANGVALVTQMAPIDVEFAVPQDQAPALQRNAAAFMEAKALDRTRSTELDTGVFASLDNQVDVQTGTVRAKARFNNTRGQLFPSQFVNIRLQLRTITGAVVVPVSALRTGGNGDYVFILREDRTVTMRPVTRGQATVDKVQIASGLAVGERVITEGADRLREGSRVALPGDAPGAGMRRRLGASAPQGGASAAAAPAGTEAAAPAQPRQRATGGESTAPAAPATPAAAAPAAARPAAPAAAAPVAAGDSKGPSAERRARMLDSAKDNPEQLERLKKFLEALDRGDPAAMERWAQMQQRRREGGGPPQ